MEMSSRRPQEGSKSRETVECGRRCAFDSLPDDTVVLEESPVLQHPPRDYFTALVLLVGYQDFFVLVCGPSSVH